MDQVRKSLFDVLKENLRKEEKKNYIHRFIYFGRHMFGEGPSSMKQFFENVINSVNSKCYDEDLTGVLLHYPKHFIHITEGSENSLAEHIKRIYPDQEANKEKFQTCKVLIVWHHIRERYFSDWFCVSAIPPTLLEEIHPGSNMDETERIIKTCITKLIQLSEYLQKQHVPSLKNALQNISRKVPSMLPEYAVLDFLLNSKALMDIHEYEYLYSNVEEWIPYQVDAGNGCKDVYSFLRTIRSENKPILTKFTTNNVIQMSDQLAMLRIKIAWTTADIITLMCIPPVKLVLTCSSVWQVFLENGVPVEQERVWPVPTDFVPYDVYSLPYQPKELKEKCESARDIAKVESVPNSQ